MGPTSMTIKSMEEEAELMVRGAIQTVQELMPEGLLVMVKDEQPEPMAILTELYTPVAEAGDRKPDLTMPRQEELEAAAMGLMTAAAVDQRLPTELLILEAEVAVLAILIHAIPMAVPASYFYTYIKEANMAVHQTYAIIYEETVQQVSLFDNYEEANQVARAVYGDTAIAVDCQQYPCQAGDKYINNTFYKADGVTPIPYIPTQEQQVAQLRAENQELTLALADVIGGGANVE